MHSRRWMVVVVMALALAMCCSGCKKFRRKKSGVGDVGGVVGSDVYGEALGERPMGGIELAGQFAPVYFDYDSAQVRETERAKIETVADSLRRSPGSTLIIEGHCDERGSNEYNLALGERRALAVRAYLVGLGVDSARVQTKSYGEERPVAFGHEESSWGQNRRGEFVIVQ